MRASKPTTVRTTVVERVMQRVPSGDGGEFERLRFQRDGASDDQIDAGLRLVGPAALSLIVGSTASYCADVTYCASSKTRQSML